MCGNGDRVWLKGAEKHLEGLSRAEAGSQSRGTLNLTFLCDFFLLCPVATQAFNQQGSTAPAFSGRLGTGKITPVIKLFLPPHWEASGP